METFLTSLWYIGIPLVFLIIVIYVFRAGARRRYDRDARIPFEENNTRERNKTGRD
jgi:cbb3-type cytochrome oxidase subunit 3